MFCRVRQDYHKLSSVLTLLGQNLKEPAMSIEKRTCLGCRALTTSRRNPCLLKHRVKSVYKYPDSKPIPMPVNKQCHRPKTYAELARLQDEKTGQSRTKA